MKRRNAASLTSVLWGVFTFLGYALVSDLAQRRVPGYPNADQWHYYVHLPLIMLLISIGLLLLARKTPVALFVTLWLLQVCVFIPFFLAYTGGM
jgi:hypothetical protein